MRIKSLITTFCFLSFPLLAQWTTLSFGTGKDLESVQWLDNNTIFKGSDVLERSTDGGASFQPHLIQVNGITYLAGIYDLHFFDANTGVVTGCFNFCNDGGIFRTTNGGQSWTLAHGFNDGPWPRDLNDLFFFDNSTGWAVGAGGRILKTTNGGQSWIVQNTGISMDLRATYFTSAVKGFAIGQNKLFKTANGGSSWTSVSLPGDPEDIQFVDSNTGFIGGDGILQKTTNGGINWQNLPIPDDSWIRDLHFFDAQNGYLVTTTSVYQTTDGGQKWEESVVSLQSEWVQAFSWLNPNQGIVVGENTLTRITSNGGGIYKPVAKFNLPSSNYYCEDTPFQLSNQTFDFANYSYQWQLNGVLFSTERTPNIVFPNPGTTYLVKLIVSSPTASDTVVRDFTTYPAINFELPPIQASSQLVCEGSTVTLTNDLSSGNSIGVFWTLLANGLPTGVSGTFSQLNKTLTITKPTLFTLSGRVTNACDTVILSTEIFVDMIPLPPNPPRFFEKNKVCVGDSTRILFPGSIPGLTYRLDKFQGGNYHSSQTKVGNGDTLVFWTGKTDDFWDFKLFLQNGTCSRNIGAIGSVHAELVYANTTYENYTYAVGDTIRFSKFNSAGNEFNWTFGNNATPPTATGPNVTTVFNEPGLYPITLTAKNITGCTGSTIAYAEIFPRNNLPDLGSVSCYQKPSSLEFGNDNLFHKIIDVFVSGDGSTYVTGNLGQYSSLFFSKHDPEGNLVWKYESTQASNGGQEFYHFIGTAITADAMGNVYLAGSFNADRIVFDGQVIHQGAATNKGFLFKLDPQGHLIWSTVIRPAGFGTNPTDIIYLNDDHILVLIAGSISTIQLPSEMIVVEESTESLQMLEVNSNGERQQLRSLCKSAQFPGNTFSYSSIYGGWDTYHLHYVSPRMVLNQQGEIVISGEFTGAFLADSILVSPLLEFGIQGFVLTIDQSLNLLRTFTTYAYSPGSQFVGSVLEDDKFATFAVDASGNVYQSFCLQPDIYGIYQPENANTQAFIQDSMPEFGRDGQYLVKYSPDGELLWSVRNGRLYLKDLVLLPDGNLYGLVGFSGTLGLNDRFGQKFGLKAVGQKDVAIVQWSSEGEVLGVKALGNTPNYDHPEWLEANGCGKLIALFVPNGDVIFSDTFSINIARIDPFGTCSPSCALMFLQQPQDGNFCPAASTKLYVSAIGDGLTYQWQMEQNGDFIPLNDGPEFTGTSSAELIISAQSTASLEGNLFRCVITDQDGGQLISQSVTIVAQNLPLLVQQAPALLIGAPFQYFAVHLVAEGMDLAYQWQFLNNGVWTNVLSNDNTYDVKTDSLLIYAQDTSLLSGRQYRCVITNGAGCTVISNTTTVFFETSSAINPVEKLPTVVYWPNPAGALLNISWTTAPAMVWAWQVCDVTGRVLLEGQSPNSNQRAEIDLQPLLPGTYFLKLTYSKGVLQRSFVKF